MSHVEHNRWFPFGFGSVLASHRLFCLPFAGGGASFFLPWRKALADLAVVPVQYPGRETRMAEACRTDLAQLVEELAQAILSQLDRPYYLLGYSLGAKVGFALCHRLAEIGVPAPELFLPFAHSAPDVPHGYPGANRLPDAEFFQHLQSYGGLPDIVLEDPDLMRMLLPILRADIGLVEHAVPNQPLACPILAYAGMHDRAADPIAVGGWRRFAQNGFALRSFDGGHFFARTAQDFLPTLAGDLRCA